MAWKDISSTVVKYKDTYGSEPSGHTAVCLQYDDSTLTPEAVSVRFKYYRHDGSSGNLWDSMYVLYNANDSVSSIGNLRRTLFKFKDWTQNVSAKWPYYTSAFTIYKNYNSKEFSLQDFWVCNNGNTAIAVSASNFYSSSRFNSLACKYASSTFTISRTAATAGSAPTISVVDKGDNRVAISGSLGKNGSYNNIKSAILYYTTDGSDPKTSGTRTTKTLTATSGASYTAYVNLTKACTVRAYVECEFTYNTTSASGSVSAKYYAKPSNPGKPALAASSFKNGRLTIKQDWGWEWPLATAANANSPVKGYRIRFYVNAAINPIVSYYTGEALSYELADFDWVYDRPATAGYPMPMRPTDQDLVPGDTFRLSIQAYTVNGAGTKLLSSMITSDLYTVQNAGVVNVKVNNQWVEGQVYVNVNNTWQEAETVNVKANNTWQESQ
jgi:hypothetical protein